MMYWHEITKIKTNKNNNVIINQIVPREMSKDFCSSHDIIKDPFNCNLNTLFSFKSIEKLSKLSKLVLWLFNYIWSKIADFLGVLTNLSVNSVIKVQECNSSHKKCLSVWPYVWLQQLHINL